MYVCMCVCIYVCMYVCTYVRTYYVCMHFFSLSIYLSICLLPVYLSSIHSSIHQSIHPFVRPSVYLYHACACLSLCLSLSLRVTNESIDKLVLNCGKAAQPRCLTSFSRYQVVAPPCDENYFEDEGFSLDDDDVMDLKLAPDPFQCTLQINAREGEGHTLKKLFEPLLEGIDPTFQFICVSESKDVNSPLMFWERGTPQGMSLECQAVAVVLFLHESFGRLSAVSVRKNFQRPPWKFHHRVELAYNVKPRVTATQDFHQTFPDLPLWSICPVHYGNEHLRFHIFVRDFPRMKTFYEMLTGKKAVNGSPGFCYFSIYTQRGLDIQLSLKHLPQVLPRPSSTVHLRLRIRDLSSVAPHLISCPTPYREGTWLTSDPDGNSIILEETTPLNACCRKQRLLSAASLETSDYETASADTDSLTGNSCYSPQVTLLQFQSSDEILI